jgi:quercetin dioxygenase-like cupin family protein
MQVTRLGDARRYDAPGHFDCTALRLQGLDASDAKNFTVGISHFLPRGGVEMAATELEKVYVCLAGEVTVVTESDETTLRPHDSIYLAPNEARAIENRTNLPATMLVVMPPPSVAA